MMSEYQYSERQACKLLSMDRTTYRYQPRPDHNAELRSKLIAPGAAEAALRLPAFVRAAGTQADAEPVRNGCTAYTARSIWRYGG